MNDSPAARTEPMKTHPTCPPLPACPTDALPGSKEKIRILAERARNGVSLWHPLDPRLDRPRPGRPSRTARLLLDVVLDDESPSDLCLAS
jgi:hypothetical protein